VYVVEGVLVCHFGVHHVVVLHLQFLEAFFVVAFVLLLRVFQEFDSLFAEAFLLLEFENQFVLVALQTVGLFLEVQDLYFGGFLYEVEGFLHFGQFCL
jgi:hypothetical protein